MLGTWNVFLIKSYRWAIINLIGISLSVFLLKTFFSYSDVVLISLFRFHKAPKILSAANKTRTVNIWRLFTTFQNFESHSQQLQLVNFRMFTKECPPVRILLALRWSKFQRTRPTGIENPARISFLFNA